MPLGDTDLPRLWLQKYIALHVRNVVTIVAKYSCQSDVTQLSQLLYNREIVGEKLRRYNPYALESRAYQMRMDAVVARNRRRIYRYVEIGKIARR